MFTYFKCPIETYEALELDLTLSYLNTTHIDFEICFKINNLGVTLFSQLGSAIIR